MNDHEQDSSSAERVRDNHRSFSLDDLNARIELHQVQARYPSSLKRGKHYVALPSLKQVQTMTFAKVVKLLSQSAISEYHGESPDTL